MTVFEIMGERHDALGLAGLLDHAGGEWRCPCGNDNCYDQRQHVTWHMRWAQGVPMGKACRLDWVLSTEVSDTLLVVSQDDRVPLRRLAYDVGRLFQREQHYDFPPLPFPGRGGERWSDEPTAYLAVWRQQAIGLVVMHTVRHWGYMEKRDADGYVHFDEPTPLRGIAGVFVCGNYRRRGLARRLIDAACDKEDQSVSDTPWAMPFSTAGRELAQSLTELGLLRVSR